MFHFTFGILNQLFLAFLLKWYDDDDASLIWFSNPSNTYRRFCLLKLKWNGVHKMAKKKKCETERRNMKYFIMSISGNQCEGKKIHFNNIRLNWHGMCDTTHAQCRCEMEKNKILFSSVGQLIFSLFYIFSLLRRILCWICKFVAIMVLKPAPM